MPSMLAWIYRWVVWLIVIGATLGIVLGFGGRFYYNLDALSYFRPHLGIIAAIGSMLAWWLPRRRVKWIGFGAAALAFAMLGPVWRAVELPADPLAKTQDVTVMTANLFKRNPSLGLTVSALLAANADVLATQETPAALLANGSVLRQHYPHVAFLAPPGEFSPVVWSKFPLTRIEAGADTWVAPVFVTAHVNLGNGAGFGITTIHMAWPLILDVQQRQIAGLGSIMPVEVGPKVMVGDFNAAPWSLAMARVEEKTGLRMVGGARRTWRGTYPSLLGGSLESRTAPNGLPAVLGHQIDHVLLSAGIGVVGVAAIPLPGSDHSGVWTVLKVPLRAPSNLLAAR